MRMLRYTIIFSLIIFIHCYLMAGPIMQIACRVNDQAITDYEIEVLADAYMRELGKTFSRDSNEYMKLSANILENLINDMLLYQAARSEGLRLTESMMQAEIERIRQSSGARSEEEFLEMLRREGMTLSSLVETLKRRTAVQLYIRKVIEMPNITEEEARDYYEENKASFVQQSQVGLSIITVKGLEKAREAHQMIQESGDFEAVARSVSTHRTAINNGGFLGRVNYDDLNPVFTDKLENLSAGDITEPFLFDGNFVILKINEILPVSYKDFSELQEDIKNLLYNKELETKYKELLIRLRNAAVIDFPMQIYREAIERYSTVYGP